MLANSMVATSIAVKDMAVATKFYEETLGLKKGSESPAGTVFMAGEGTGIFIYPSSFAGTNKATYASWLDKDVEGVAADLESKGVKLEQYDDLPGVTREGNLHKMGDEMVGIWFKDPDGNILSVTNTM